MSSTKLQPAEAPHEEKVSRPLFSTDEAPKKEKKKSADAPRGSNVTPKDVMHVGRNWGQSSWNQAFKALCKKWDRENYSKKSELK